jgi:predicted SnoaL-like aldol condensation-catalyzing enzyme
MTKKSTSVLALATLGLIAACSKAPAPEAVGADVSKREQSAPLADIAQDSAVLEISPGNDGTTDSLKQHVKGRGSYSSVLSASELGSLAPESFDAALSVDGLTGWIAEQSSAEPFKQVWRVMKPAGTFYADGKDASEANRRRAFHLAEAADLVLIRGSQGVAAVDGGLLFQKPSYVTLDQPGVDVAKHTRNKETAIAFYHLALRELKFREAIETYTGADYRQHNPGVADGKEGFISNFEETKRKWPGGGSYVLRAVADGDFVALHVRHKFDPAPGVARTASIDIFRFDADGKIIEHWDAMQNIPETSVNKNGVLDGPLLLEDAAATNQNRELVRTFSEQVLIGGDLASSGRYFDGDRYIQHNARIADGVQGWRDSLEEMSTSGKPLKYRKLHGIYAEGNLVFTMSEGEFNGLKTTAIMDLYRLEKGKIAEHWDVIYEALPEKFDNPNGLF